MDKKTKAEKYTQVVVSMSHELKAQLQSDAQDIDIPVSAFLKLIYKQWRARRDYEFEEILDANKKRIEEESRKAKKRQELEEANRAFQILEKIYQREESE